MSFAYSEGNPVEDTSKHGHPPFDTGRLDRLMEEAGLDVVLIRELIARELKHPVGRDLPLQRDAVLGVARVVDDEDADVVRDPRDRW